jgi:Phage terminase, small subunit
MNELTPLAERFCHEYVIDFKAKEAAIRAGCMPVQAEHSAARWLKDPRCQAMIRELKRQVTLRSNISADWALEKLRVIADQDITEILALVLQWKGDYEDWMTKFRALPPEVRACVKSIKWGKYGPEIVQHNSMDAVALIGKYFNLFTDKLEVTGPGGAPMKMIHEGMNLKEAAQAYAESIKGGKAA